MKIIAHGIDWDEQFFTVDCDKCKCKFQIKATELDYKGFIKCPEEFCRNDIYVAEKGYEKGVG